MILSRFIYFVGNSKISFFFHFLRNFCSGYTRISFDTLNGFDPYSAASIVSSSKSSVGLTFVSLHVKCLFTFGCLFFFIPECKQFDIMSYHVFFTFLPGVLRYFGFVGLYFSQIWKSIGHWFSKFSLPPPWGTSYMYSKYLMSHSWLIFCTYFLSLFSHLFYSVMSLDSLIFYSICF